MDPDYIKQMFEHGGTVVIIGLPEGTEVGIDLMSWNVVDEFKGIKMIPPGLHFIYCSIVGKYGQSAPRIGFFHYFEEKDVLVKKYNAADEDIYPDADLENVDRVKSNLKDLDRYLIPYPFESWTKWVSFSQYIDRINLKRMEPKSGKISVVQLINEDNFKQRNTAKRNQNQIISDRKNKLPKIDEEEVPPKSTPSLPKEESKPSFSLIATATSELPVMVPCPETEICFSKIPPKPHRDGAPPSEISRCNIDSSYSMSVILDKLDRPESILSEVQFSFICFLVGQVWEGWEQWRQLIILLCKAEETLLSYPALYSDFLAVLYYQLQEVPEDLFADIVENNNFMVMSLRTVFANIFDNASALPVSLVSKAKKFRENLSAKYKWGLVLEETEEDRPVVVEM